MRHADDECGGAKTKAPAKLPADLEEPSCIHGDAVVSTVEIRADEAIVPNLPTETSDTGIHSDQISLENENRN